jgi:hypothetical protein
VARRDATLDGTDLSLVVLMKPKNLPARNSSASTAGDKLAAALQECRRAARRGYKIAKANLTQSSEAIRAASRSLDGSLKTLERNAARTTVIREDLRHQLASVVQELEGLRESTERGLEHRRQRLDRFSITLFGRTLAGKSTLMEILTRGDGLSIGNGAQRTTRDVRSYPWNGLDVTDVPGIAAFEGAEDEKLAYEAANQADLVLFLVTDDAPQPVEAECLARIRRLGKPVVGICNVKIAMDDPEDLLLFLRNPNKPFDCARLDGLIEQFHVFADRHTPGSRIPFLFTHLRSRFLADCPDYMKHHAALRSASRFDAVESRLVQEVLGRGKFLRIRSFIDSAAAPMMELTDSLLGFAARNSSSANALADKRAQLIDWAKGFRKDVKERIDSLITQEAAGLREEVPGFAEDHYEDSKAGESWERLVAAKGITDRAHKLQQAIQEECQYALSEVARELKSELSLVGGFTADCEITMDSIFNLKRAWNWGTTGLAGGLTLAAVILGSGPLGWAAAAVGLGGWLISLFFQDRESKARKAREKLSKRLHGNIDKMEEHLRQALHSWFEDDLLAKQVTVLIKDLEVVTAGLTELAVAQRELAWTLNERLKVLARVLLEQALGQLRATTAKRIVRQAARVPGLGVMLLVVPNARIDGKVWKGLERLLGENLWLVLDTGSEDTTLHQAIGAHCNGENTVVDKVNRVARIPLDKLDAAEKSRIPLAQQLTGLHLIRG